MEKIILDPSVALLNTSLTPPMLTVPRITMTTILRNITITCHASVYTTALIPPWKGSKQKLHERNWK